MYQHLRQEYHTQTSTPSDAEPSFSWYYCRSWFLISHDATGEYLTFRESLDPDAVEPDGYLFRVNQVLSRWQSLSQKLLNHSGCDALWDGHHDIIPERHDRGGIGEFELIHVFVGEVK